MHLERLISILEITSQRGEVSVREICDASDLPKPSAYRLVQDLVATGLLEPAAKGRFVLGSRLKRMAGGDHTDQQVLDIAAPLLKRAADEQGVAYFLSRLRGNAVEIIHVETPQTGVSYLHPGLGKRPLHACSCSKAVAAFAAEPLLARALEGRLRAYTEYTLTRAEDVQSEFARIRAQGYAECVEEIERGMCSVAAPVLHKGRGATMSVGATGSVRVFTPAFRARIGGRLRDLAESFAEQMGAAQMGAAGPVATGASG